MKKIGVTCDLYKVKKFRRGLQKDGFDFDFDGPSGIAGVHLFRVQTTEEEFESTKSKLSRTLQRLELEVKRSN
jgi:hypothetical protein